ncbi:MAG: hypothetical protein H6618_04075 [Deltaproteobacteria bacterium]|nr:hypothetical protein [Deltaproteobacteria bacterium]
MLKNFILLMIAMFTAQAALADSVVPVDFKIYPKFRIENPKDMYKMDLDQADETTNFLMIRVSGYKVNEAVARNLLEQYGRENVFFVTEKPASSVQSILKSDAIAALVGSAVLYFAVAATGWVSNGKIYDLTKKTFGQSTATHIDKYDSLYRVLPIRIAGAAAGIALRRKFFPRSEHQYLVIRLTKAELTKQQPASDL